MKTQLMMSHPAGIIEAEEDWDQVTRLLNEAEARRGRFIEVNDRTRGAEPIRVNVNHIQYMKRFHG
jgi:hypothetical protein